MIGGAEQIRSCRVEESAPRRLLNSDYAEICRWFEGYGETPPRREWLPAIGRIVPGVLGGFLYRTDSALGFIDGFIGNPAAPAAEKLAAYETVLVALAEDAKKIGVQILVGNTKHKSFLRVLKKLGCATDPAPYFVVARVL